MNFQQKIYYASFIFILLNSADAIITMYTLHLYSPYIHELNSIFPPTMFNVFIKILVLPAILELLTALWIEFYREHTILLFTVFLVLDIMFTIIVINNVVVLCQAING